ncbi:biotin--[acetyl-CoA-carboxylase] ligase [Acinetobacter qingfengensis]|uniref:Biotin--[acetyl-CoA-carboxylase] ligase n=1 Tax=Acinetobacter qingfengensis TaxID=1262585 RepID=A0A1E7RCP1_9GAMM|nr:biotin--[acetyl-CoA-carboxylase] ligase [Acinetobacter qingfengensis]
MSACLAAAHATPEIVICKQNTQSTNDDALQLFQQGYQTALVTSQQQSQGRGQHQRQWVSQSGNIFFSALLPLQRPIDGRLALECGLSLIHCPMFAELEQLQLKWANDLYSPQGKWGGILVEPVQQKQVIIGIGINVLPIVQQQGLPPNTNLLTLGLKDYQRSELIAQMYVAMQQAIQWFNFGSQNLAQRFNAVAAFRQQNMHITRHNNPDLSGIYQGIQDDGALLIQVTDQPNPIACYDGRLVIPTHPTADDHHNAS